MRILYLILRTLGDIRAFRLGRLPQRMLWRTVRSLLWRFGRRQRWR
ncbi:MAG: hypothetical protein N2554_04020 [Fimbriimonadales bacterium]|nr:hypothetical protein [Fimbriimonadales bacterium]